MFDELDAKRWGDREILMDNGLSEEDIDKLLASNLGNDNTEWEVVGRKKKKEKGCNPQKIKNIKKNICKKNNKKDKPKKVFKNDNIKDSKVWKQKNIR